MRRWLLPEGINDLLPEEARSVEVLRRRLLDEFNRHGYQLVAPPLLEYLESLLIGSGRDLDLRTFKLVDQTSGRTLGVRADMTPQVARMDAHLLGRRGVSRLCYCGSVLHTVAAGLHGSREPLQLGAELYGHAGAEADSEIIGLLGRALELAATTATRIDLGHVGIFRALTAQAGLSEDLEQDLFAALQAKDVPTLRELVVNVPEPTRSALLALPDCYGGVEVLDKAASWLPKLPEIDTALNLLRRLASDLQALPTMPISFDLADLRGYHYHSGVVFAAYCQGSASAVALGGRYDHVGASFGRGRPATGFSLDLRELARLSQRPPNKGAILAPWPEDAELHKKIECLRGMGEIVMLALPGHDGHWREAGCDRRLVRRPDKDGSGSKWTLETLKED